MKNLNLAVQYWHGGARAIVVEEGIAEFDGYPVVIKFGEYRDFGHPCYGAFAVGADGGFDKILATDTGLGRLKAKVKKMTRPAAPTPTPTPTPAPRLPYSRPTVAEQVGLNLSFVEKLVDGMANIERQRRVAQALAVAQRKAAHAARQRMIAAGYIKPATS